MFLDAIGYHDLPKWGLGGDLMLLEGMLMMALFDDGCQRLR
jgi:hypothetical protein